MEGYDDDDSNDSYLHYQHLLRFKHKILKNGPINQKKRGGVSSRHLPTALIISHSTKFERVRLETFQLHPSSRLDPAPSDFNLFHLL